MTRRHVSRRRPVAWLMAAALGAVASVSAAAPAHAANDTCTVSAIVAYLGKPEDVTTTNVEVTITNTAAAPTKNWFVMIGWQSPVTVTMYYSVTRSTFSGYIYLAMDWNKELPKNGGSTTFGYIVTNLPKGAVSAVPSLLRCSVIY